MTSANDWKKWKLHPVAKLFPKMAEDEYQALKSDIEENGLKEPILLFEGMILDGRHRHRACLELEIEPQRADFEGSETEAFQRVTSSNLMRRHLSKSQKAMFLVDAGLIKPPAEGGKRRKYGTGRNYIMEVGRRYGVNHVTIYKAAYIHSQDRKLAKRVLAGELSVAKAEAEVNQRAVGEGAQIVDAAGKKVPRRLEAVFAARQDFGAIESHFHSAEKLLRLLGQSRLPRGALKEVRALLAEAESALKRAKPHLTCPSCGGSGCARCARRGWLPEKG